jgi:hypothetical protein
MVFAYGLMAAGGLLSMTGLIAIALTRNALHHTANI